MAIELIFETHSTSDDNERGVATGWLDGRLSTLGREQAATLGARRRGDGLAAVFASDLARARETVHIAFTGTEVPVFLDWRLRECDYGALSGTGVREPHQGRRLNIDQPYPGGEIWREAVARVGRFLDDLPTRWPVGAFSSSATSPRGGDLSTA